MKAKAKQLLLIAFLTFTAGGLAAQTPDSLMFSLSEAKEYALQNSYVMRNSELDVEAAQKKVWETIATGLPQISASSSYTKYIDLPVIRFGEETFKMGTDYNADFGVQINQLLFDGSYIVGVSSAQIYLKLTDQAKEKTQIELLHGVEQAYYASLIARSNMQVLKENLQNNQKQYADTKAMYENGFVEEQDVDQLKLLVQNSENQILKAEREIRVAEIVLKYTMGVDVSLPIELTDKLDDCIAPLVLQEEAEPVFDYSAHIDYRLLDTQRLSSVKLMKLEQSSYLPNLSATYNWGKTGMGENWNLYKSSVPWYKSSLISFNLTIPIFSSGMRAAKVKQARFELEKAENDQLQAVQNLQKDYITAIADMESAIDQYENTTDNKQLALRIYEKSKIKYNNGIITSADLAVTESQFITAQSNWVSSAMQLFNAKINLDKAIGK